jgi:hypothetical protein
MEGKQMREFKEGDKVWSPVYGFGEVDKVNQFNKKLMVSFKEYGVCYVHDGKLKEESPAPTLFRSDEIPEYYRQFIVDERIGKAGYFWDDESYWAAYGVLSSISEKSRFPFKLKSGGDYKNFSLTPPEHIK